MALRNEQPAVAEVETVAAHFVAFDQRHARAQRHRARSRHETGRAGANHEIVKIFSFHFYWEQ